MAATPPISVQSYHPTTFLERGVVVPFTTPALLGARARPAERGGPELIVANPSGGRGVYILPWGSVRELCRPTVHDSRLNELVEELPSVTPSSIRRASRRVAAEGLAGQQASTAADAATLTERQETLLTNYLLVMALLKQVEPKASDENDADLTTLEARARRALEQVAPRLGRTANAVAAVLEEIAPFFASVGVGSRIPTAPVAQARDALQQLRAAMVDWSAGNTDDSGAQASLLAVVAETTITCAQATVTEAHAVSNDTIRLLRDWNKDAGRIQQLVARPEWLLDGWEQICALWTSADTEVARRAVLPEMSMLAPVLPREVSDWVAAPVDMHGMRRLHETVALNKDWRTGSTVFELIARNERLRALAA